MDRGSCLKLPILGWEIPEDVGGGTCEQWGGEGEDLKWVPIHDLCILGDLLEVGNLMSRFYRLVK